MAIIDKVGVCVALAGILLLGSSARALSPADKCEASELKTSGKYASCRLKADSKAVKTGGLPDFSKCDSTFSDKFGKADTKGMGQCPSSATQAQIQTFITQCTDGVAAAIGGAPLPVCQPPPLKTGQTTAYGAGSDGDLQKGASRSYTDNGDGTITDNTTGLMWEKKSRDGSIHDNGNSYTWSGASYGGTNIMDGTITSTFLVTLNSGGGFAGHADWRIPNRFELESLLNLQNSLPAIDPAFNTNCVASCTVTTCSCTQVDNFYWSSTTYPPTPSDVWMVDFYDGTLDVTDGFADGKSGTAHVRAVRGGS